MGELILLRHGETEWSLAGKHTGRTDVSLTPYGEAAAAKLAPLLARRHIVAAFTSPARRAVTTAALAGLADAKHDRDLWEWDYGGYEGLTTEQIRETRPGWYLWRDGVIPGDTEHPGEAVEQVGERADRVLGRVVPLLGDGDVVLVAHGHMLRVLTARYLRLEPTAGRMFRLDTGTLSTLGAEHSEPVITSLNVPSPDLADDQQHRQPTRSDRTSHSQAPYRLKASWAGRVSSRIQFRYAVEPATMGSATISGSS
jgi:broad specificity phosphatase PhoE